MSTTLLPEVDENRLWRFIPGSRDPLPIRWTNPATDTQHQATVDVDVRWRNQDRDAYPCVVLDPDPAGRPVEGTPLDDWERSTNVPSENDIQRRVAKRTKLFDILNIHVAAQSPENGIPASEVADAIAKRVYERFRFESDRLNRKAVRDDGSVINDSTAMKIEEQSDGIRNTSDPQGQTATERRHMQWRVEYKYQYEREITAVDKVKWSLDVDADGDGDTDTTYSGTIDIDLSSDSGDQDSL